MSSQSSWNRNEYGPSIIAQRVWFSGTTAVRKGMGFCFDLTATEGAGTDTGELTEADSPRGNVVAVPSSSNNRAFAGVALQAKTADADGQLIDIALPGSVVDVEIGVATVNQTGILTCSVNSQDAGRFVQAGFAGRGSFIPLQTVANHATDDGPVFSEFIGSGDVDTADGKTLTASSAVLGNVLVGDNVVIYGIEDDGTRNTNGTLTTTVAEITSSTIIVLTDAVADTGADMNIAYYIYRGGPPLCRGLLLDGDQSGLTEYVMLVSGGAAQTMVGGYSYIGPEAILGGDSTAVLADGTVPYEIKGFRNMGAITSAKDWILTITSGDFNGFTTGGQKKYALKTLEFDLADSSAIMRWTGSGWVIDALSDGGVGGGPVATLSAH